MDTPAKMGGRMPRRAVAVVAVGALMVVMRATTMLAQTPEPPAAEKGAVTGTVTDKVSGEPVIDAGVEVVDQKITTRTDVDGKYILRLPPGKYQIRFFAPLHQPLRLQNIV